MAGMGTMAMRFWVMSDIGGKALAIVSFLYYSERQTVTIAIFSVGNFRRSDVF